MRAARRICPAAVYCELEREADRSFGAHARVHRTLGGDLVRRTFAKDSALAHIRALRVLPDHDEVVRHGVTGRGTDERALIHVEVEVEAHLQQQTPLDHPRRYVGGTDGAKQDGIELAELVQRGVRQDLAVTQVPRPTQVVLGDIQLDSGGLDHLQCFGCHLGADAVAADHRNSICHRPEMLRGDSVFSL